MDAVRAFLNRLRDGGQLYLTPSCSFRCGGRAHKRGGGPMCVILPWRSKALLDSTMVIVEECRTEPIRFNTFRQDILIM
jgi:hypothetical protein